MMTGKLYLAGNGNVSQALRGGKYRAAVAIGRLHALTSLAYRLCIATIQ